MEVGSSRILRHQTLNLVSYKDVQETVVFSWDSTRFALTV